MLNVPLRLQFGRTIATKHRRDKGRVIPMRKQNAWVPLFLIGLTLSFFSTQIKAQRQPGAARTLQLSAFGLLGETYTGLGGASNGLGGRNLSLTAGLDLGVYNLGRTGFALEGRGTYPLSEGHVDGQLSALGGVRIDHVFSGNGYGRIVPYVDFLFGRGEIRYVNGGFPAGSLTYTRTAANIYSGGGGLEFTLTRRLAIKADAQLQHWPTPVVPNGRIYAKQGSLGVLYRFGIRRTPQ